MKMQEQRMVKLNERPIRIARVAELTEYSVGYLYSLVSTGQIPYHKRQNAGKKSAVRFFESEIIAWMTHDKHESASDLHDMARAILNGERK
jgi:predicted DNA-binding transcriptional regulator AlpA